MEVVPIFSLFLGSKLSLTGYEDNEPRIYRNSDLYSIYSSVCISIRISQDEVYSYGLDSLER